MIATAKAKKEPKEVYRRNHVNNSDKRPFWISPSLQKQNWGLFVSFTASKYSRGQSTSSSKPSQESQPPLKSKRPFGKSFLKKEGNLSENNFTSTKNAFSGYCTNVYQLKYVHLLVLNLFPKGETGNLALARRLQYFLENWKIVTNDSKILEWVSGLKYFQEEPFQERVLHQAQVSMQESKLITQEVEAMLRKGAIHLVHSKSQFLSNLFLVPKKDGGTGLLSIWRH